MTITTLNGNGNAVSLKIIGREAVNHDTIRLKLALPSADHVLGSKVCQHVYLKSTIDGEEMTRPYNPVTKPNTKGYVDFIIKVYRPNAMFPQGGKMTTHLESIPIGSSLEVSGPAGKLSYEDNGNLTVKSSNQSKSYQVKHVNLLAGGSGLTPIYQLLKYALESSNDTTKFALLYANKTEQDILVRDELESLRSEHPDRFRVWYTVSEAPANWTYGVGFVNENLIREHLYPAHEDTFTMVCGPPDMIREACIPNLKKLGHDDEHILGFF